MRRSEPKVVFFHRCEIDTGDESQIISPFTRHPYYYRLRNKFDRFRTIRKSKQAETYFRSRKAIVTEQRRHLTTPDFKYTIHPFSKLVQVENAIMFVIWFIIIIDGPLIWSFYYLECVGKDFTFRSLLINISRVTVFCDIIMRFFVGYLVEKTGEIVLDRRIIVKNYLRTYFFFDVSSPFCGLVLLVLPNAYFLARLLVCQLNYLALCRIKTLLELADIFLKKLRFRENSRICFFLFLLSVCLVHWSSCILRLITVIYENLEMEYLNDTWYYEYLQERNTTEMASVLRNDVDVLASFQLYFAHLGIIMCHFYGAGSGLYQTEDSVEMFLLAFILMIGMIFYIYAIAKILQMFGSHNISESKFEELIHQAEQYMVTQRFPKELKKRALKYYTYKFDKRYFSEAAILDSMSPHLRMEVLLHSARIILESTRAFKNLSKTVLGSFIPSLKSEIYLPQDVIMRSDQEEYFCFFIQHGTCAVKLLSDVEILHVEDGDNFGNMAQGMINFESSFVYKIVAIEPCQIYYIDIESYRYHAEKFPEMLDKLEMMAKGKHKHYNEMYSRYAGSSQTIDIDDILHDLRRGKILYQGRKRIDL